MQSTAILVDGGFYLKRAHDLWGEKAPQDRAEELFRYCLHHINTERRQARADTELYRIFFYDCPPSSRTVHHPITGNVDLKKTALYKWSTDFHQSLRSKRKVALRLGRLADERLGYVLSPKATRELLSGKLQVTDLKDYHFNLNITQKGVDIKLSIDIASMAYKRQVNQIILVAGDSDFVPITKLARREGIDVILDPMGNHIPQDLQEHIDGIRSFQFDVTRPKPTN